MDVIFEIKSLSIIIQPNFFKKKKKISVIYILLLTQSDAPRNFFSMYFPKNKKINTLIKRFIYVIFSYDLSYPFWIKSSNFFQKKRIMH